MSTTRKSEKLVPLASQASVKYNEEHLRASYVALDQKVITLLFAVLCPLIIYFMIIGYNTLMPMLINCRTIDTEWMYAFCILVPLGYGLMRYSLHCLDDDYPKRSHLTYWQTFGVFLFALFFPFMVYHILPFLMIGCVMFYVVVIAIFLRPETIITDWMVGVCMLLLTGCVCVALISYRCLKRRETLV